MESHQSTRRAAAIAAGGAVVAMAVFAACATTPEKPAPTSPTTPSTPTTASPTSVEKSLDPHSGNLFTPGKTAPPAPTVAPGQHHPPGAG